MSSILPLTVRSRALLLSLELQCNIARRQIVQGQLAAPQFRLQHTKASPVSSKESQSQSQSQPQPPLKPPPKSEDDHIPKPLNRPLGLTHPPLPGENTGLDPRDWRQRRDDFFDYDKHLARRKQLTKQVAKPYFRDWSNMQYQKGKVFVAPPKLLRADKALYFPNLWGFTLASPKDERDTTPVLHGKLSVVAVFSGTWAEQQTKTFLEKNQRLNSMLAAGSGFLQRVDINIEQNSLKARLVKWFMGGLRRKLPEEQHGKYFLVTQGVTDGMRESMGMFNAQIGYIYLLDSECRVRWAGSAEAQEEEKESMLRGIGRLSRELVKVAVEKKQGDAAVDTEALQVSPAKIKAGTEKIAAIAGV